MNGQALALLEDGFQDSNSSGAFKKVVFGRNLDDDFLLLDQESKEDPYSVGWISMGLTCQSKQPFTFRTTQSFGRWGEGVLQGPLRLLAAQKRFELELVEGVLRSERGLFKAVALLVRVQDPRTKAPLSFLCNIADPRTLLYGPWEHPENIEIWGGEAFKVGVTSVFQRLLRLVTRRRAFG